MCVKEELATCRSVIPSDKLLSCTSAFVRFTIAETRLKTLTATCQFPTSYPSSPLIVELQSQTILADTVSKLQDACENEAQRLSRDNLPQVIPVWTLLNTILRRNKLLLCSDEILRIRKFLTGANDTLRLSEKAGTITIHIEEAKSLLLEFELKINHAYPDEPLEIKCQKSNFPECINLIFFKQAEDIAGKCCKGASAANSVRDSDPAKPSVEVVRVATLAQFKHDVKFLKEQAQWGAMAVNSKGRKRKQIFEKCEMRLEAQSGNLPAVSSQGPDTEEDVAYTLQSVGVPSLYAVADFLINKYIRLLPHVCCAHCEKTLIDCKESLFGEKLPQKAYCGHWFHADCLTVVMNTPPFGLLCPGGCQSQVYHPKWTSDAYTLEQRWATREAHRREEEEILGLLDM